MEASNLLTQPAQSYRCVSCFVEFVDIYQTYDISIYMNVVYMYFDFMVLWMIHNLHDHISYQLI